MFADFIEGFTSYFKALSFVQKHKLYGSFIISGLISLSIGLAIIYLAYFCAGNIGSFLISFYPFDFGVSYIERIAAAASGGLVTVGGFFLFRYIVLVCIGPFMGPLSYKVERIIRDEVDEPDNGGLKRAAYELIRGIRVALRNVTRELVFTVILLILGFIPLLTVFITPLLFLVQAYYVGFANTDYFLERRATVRESVTYNRDYRWISIGNGAAFLLLLFIPVVGLFLAPVLGTVAATITSAKRVR